MKKGAGSLNMADEKNLWKQLKNNTKSIIWTRIEATSGLGIPDLFGYYRRGFWVELKIINNNKLNFSAHQIAWINRHYSEGCPVFVLAKDPPSKTLRLFSGSIVRDPTSIADKPSLCSIVPGSRTQGWEQLLLMLASWTPDGISISLH
tara:strand:+ start:2234 stop:2677 length:444 start_codon:yes stop_codon:yes gene_type:complete